MSERTEHETTDSAGEVESALLSCPNCGHDLSMFMESDPDADELWARRAIEVIINWRFPVGMLVVIVIWIAFNLIFKPFEPQPVFTIATLAATVTTVSALQGPLILLTQRRALERDRQRDRATHLVAANTEHDVHVVRDQLRRLTAEVSALNKKIESRSDS